MNTTRACLLFVAVSLGSLLEEAVAQTLPKTGSISWHTGWRSVGEVLDVAKGRAQGHGSVIGISFNNAGSGALHQGPAECVYTFLLTDGNGPVKGYCAFGDSDGDRIFTDFSGEGGSGTNVIVGGTGKYAGITGSGPWNSSPRGSHGALATTQRLDYRLP
ncbi:MAG: hypothetical protein U1F52_10385 [Burkholderiales bacterium]